MPAQPFRVVFVTADAQLSAQVLRWLRAAGCHAEGASQARQWAGFRPHLTLVDGDIPGPGCSLLATAIRPLLAKPQRLVCLTADPANTSSATAAAFDEVVCRPRDAAELARLVRLWRTSVVHETAQAEMVAA